MNGIARTALLSAALGLAPLLHGTLPGAGLARAGASLACLLLGLLAIERVLRDLTTPACALATALLLLYGTFLFGYATKPSEAVLQALVFLLSSLVLALWWLSRARLSPWASVAFLVGGCALASLLGRPAPSLLRSEGLAILDALFSSRQGLLYWTPLLWGGLFGYVTLLGRDPRAALMLAGGLAAVLAVATREAPGGAFFAGGRFDAALPLLAPGLAASLASLRSLTARRPGTALVAGGVALGLWNLLFVEQYRRDRIPRDETVAFARVTGTSAAILAELVGSPLAWPANWIFAERHDLPPSSYDLMVGKSLFRGEGAVQGVIDLGDDRVDPALLAEGWSGRRSCGSQVCRSVRGRARLFAPLETSGGGSLTVRAAGSGTLGVCVNGARLAELPLSAELADFRVPVPSGVLRSGWNEIALESDPPEALVDRVILPPPGRP